MPRTILITGASSGIGKALAFHYARQGARLALVGRDGARMQDAADECRALGGYPTPGLTDVRDRSALADWILSFDRETPVDLVIANAGQMTGTPSGGQIEAASAALEIVETNVLGVLNTVQPLLAPMMARRRGQIAIVSSLAAFLPLPDSPSYCASKSAALSYGLALRALLAPYRIGVTVVCPGYIDTPMLRRESGAKPFKMSAERAALVIANALTRDPPVLAFPFWLALATRLHGMLPDPFRARLLRAMRFTVSDP